MEIIDIWFYPYYAKRLKLTETGELFKLKNN